MFANLSLGALMRSVEFPTAVQLATRHGFGGLDPDIGYLKSLNDHGRVRELAADVADHDLRWGVAPLPVSLTAPAATFIEDLSKLHDDLDLYRAANVTALGTWIRPMDDILPYRRNWTRHAGRIALVAEALTDSGMSLGLEYVGPKTFWSTERHPFIHSLTEVRELIADSGAGNVGIILDTFHWYTAGEGIEDLRTLRSTDVISVDINDAPMGRDRDSQEDLHRCLPGTTGTIDLPGFMDALRAMDYDGPVKVEPFMKSLAQAPIDDLLAEVSYRLTQAVRDGGRGLAASRLPAGSSAS